MADQDGSSNHHDEHRGCGSGHCSHSRPSHDGENNEYDADGVVPGLNHEGSSGEG